MAPELLLGKQYNGEKADAFAIGVALFTLVFQRPPFLQARLNDKFYKLIHKNKLDLFWKAHCNGDDELVSGEFKDLISSLFCPNPDKRPTLEQIIKHPWITDGETPSPEEFKQEMESRYEATLTCLAEQEQDEI